MRTDSSERKCQTILVTVSAFMLLIPLHFLFMVAPANGQAVEGTIRLFATIALLYFLLKRKNWARLTLVLFALTGAVYLDVRLVFFHESLTMWDMLEIGIKGIVYTLTGLLLAFSRSIKMFFEIKRSASAI